MRYSEECMKIAQGAEATIFQNNNSIIKNRFEKKYRHPLLDKKLRTTRTRHEAKILKKLEELNIAAPKIKNISESVLEMEKIEGTIVKHVLNESIAGEMGKSIAALHKNDIIHGDLTTSNMIWNGKLFLIDFGLSFISLKAEDKAVDLHVMEESLQGTHATMFSEVYPKIIAAYKKNYKDADEILKRLELVRKRGRNKAKY